MTDALNHVTGYSYDASDRVATRTDPVLSVARYQYDANDHLTQPIDRKGQVTSYHYDDRLTLVTYADASTTQYTYDAGRPAAAGRRLGRRTDHAGVRWPGSADGGNDAGRELGVIRSGGHLSCGDTMSRPMADTPKRARRQFTDDFKASAVRLVLDEGKTVGAAAREVGPGSPPLSATSWRGCGKRITSCGRSATF